MLALDGKKDVLILLDLSAAFDTIDYDVFLARLEKRYGVDGTALKWFESYLRDRYQSVGVDVRCPRLSCGVPQGSVLGPTLFTLYSAPLENIVLKHGLELMIYADDTQLYVTCSKAVDINSKQTVPRRSETG